MPPKALIFLHIPKTAGTTLNRIIECQYNPLAIFTRDPHRFRATAKRFKTLSEERRRRYRVVRGHLQYGIHKFLPQGGTYVTLLREPTSRVLSSYYFILRRPLHPLHWKLKRGRLGVEEFIRSTPQRQNLQCRFIAGIGKDTVCDERTLDQAKQNLARFQVVGLCERFQESLLLMRRSFGWKVVPYENRKVSKTRPEVDPDTLEMIREHNQLDVKLYQFGKELFEEQLRAMGRFTEEELTTPATVPTYLESIGRLCLPKLCLGLFVLSKIASAL